MENLWMTTRLCYITFMISCLIHMKKPMSDHSKVLQYLIFRKLILIMGLSDDKLTNRNCKRYAGLQVNGNA